MERKREGKRESDGGEGTCVCGEWMEEAVNERLRKRNNGGGWRDLIIDREEESESKSEECSSSKPEEGRFEERGKD